MRSEQASDAEVIAAVLGGDVDAFSVLVERYEGEFAAYASYMTGNRDDAADVVQESFVRAYRSLKRCKDPANFKGWVFRIVSNQCKTHLARRKRRRTESLQHTAALPSDDNPGQDAEVSDLRRQLNQALLALPLDQREALVLKYVYGLDIREMTQLLSASRSAVKMRLMRARTALRAKLDGVVQ